MRIPEQSEITIEPGQAEIVIRVPLKIAQFRVAQLARRHSAVEFWLPRELVEAAVQLSEQQEIDAEQSARRNP